MSRKLQIRSFRLSIILCLLFAVHPLASAEVSFGISNCEDLKDEAKITQAEFCEAHVGCKLVLEMQASCVTAKEFLNRLSESIKRPVPVLSDEPKQDGLLNRFAARARGFLVEKKDGRNPIESTHVLEAAASPAATERAAMDPDWRKRVDQIKLRLLEAERNEVTGEDNGVKWVYIGDSRFNKAQGWGSKFYADGSVQAGQFEQGQIKGEADLISRDGGRRTGRVENAQLQGKGFEYYPDGNSYSGDFEAGRRQGQGTLVQADGSRIIGNWWADQLNGSAAKYKADGSIEEQGIYKNGTMVLGQAVNRNTQIGSQTQSFSGVYDQAVAIAEQARINAEQARLAAEKAKLHEQQIAKAKQEKEIREVRIAQSQRQLKQANESLKPIASPALDQLINRIPKGGH